MMKFAMVLGMSALLAVAAPAANGAHGHGNQRTLAVIMTNDDAANQIKVYDAGTGALLQTLSTRGKGGVGGNARGVNQFNGRLFAAVNFGSNTVALFSREGNRLRFEDLVATTSAPVSVDFGNGHMYVAGATTVDSFVLRRNRVVWRDGSAVLELAGGGSPPAGSTAQVGVLDRDHLLVTLKTDPTPGTVDVVSLQDGAITSDLPAAVSAPAGSLTPFGFSVYPDGTALITLAHSDEDALFRNGAFVEVTGAGQGAPCWTTAVGKYVFTANTASRSISRIIGTGSHVFVDAAVAASVPTGGPTDLDAADGVLGVIDHGSGTSHLTMFSYNRFGELSPSGAAIDLGVANANGVAIVAASRFFD